MDQRLRTARPIHGGRHGYTLLEILVATTLSLLLMYGVAAVFSQVGSLMSQTQNVMGMSNSLRSARDRLSEDLSLLTVPKLKAPTSRNGFFCYTEGLGADDQRIITANQDLAAAPLADPRPIYLPRTSMIDTEGGGVDTTAGDTDDILSFTLRAKEGEWFRGRFPMIIEDDTLPPKERIKERIIESEFAEVAWFVRGTTLYRRVLLIVPDDVLQQNLALLQLSLEEDALSQSLPVPKNVCEGYGFFRYYDVSVHLDDNGRIAANTVADLANRKNRYGYWSSPVLGQTDGLYDSRQGYNGAWYWLRLPTLQESAAIPAAALDDGTRYFCAGRPFGTAPDSDWEKLSLNPQVQDAQDRWYGKYQKLSQNIGDSVTLSVDWPLIDGSITYSGNDYFAPFIDLWNRPNLWREVNSYQEDPDTLPDRPDTGDLNYCFNQNNGSCFETFNQDVLLTNVLSFDVKAWDDAAGMYVDLGNRGYRIDRGATVQTYSNLGRTSVADETLNEANRFDDFGRYKFNGGLSYLSYGFRDGDSVMVSLPVGTFKTPFLPAVFDTWTEEYELQQLNEGYDLDGGAPGPDTHGVTRRSGFTPSDIPLDGEVTSAMLPDYPPPYDKELKAISIELRVFDPVSRAIKNTTLNVDLTKR